MELSPWTVYWVMQLDAIGTSATLFALVSFVGTFAWGTAKVLARAGDDEAEALRSVLWPVPILFVIATTTATLLPSTKTAAAMIVLPALTSDAAVDVYKDVGAEAKEIIGLAKDALREAAGKPKAEPEREPDK